MNYSLVASESSRKYLRISVAAFFFVQGLSFAAWASRIPDIKNMLRLSEGALGTVLLALPIGLMASLPISGWLVTRFGSKKIVMIGAILYAATLSLIGFVTRTEQLVIVLFAFGLWSNLTNIAVNTQAVAVEKAYGRSIMASFHGIWSMAGFLSAMVGSYFISTKISPQIHFVLIALLAFGIIMTAYKHTVPDSNKNDGESQPMFVKPDKQLLILGLIGFCSMVCEGAMFDWSGVYFHEAVHAPAAYTSLGYVAFMGTMTGGRFAADWLSNKYGKKRILQLSGILMGTGLAISVLFPYMITATIGFLLVGFGVSSVVPLVYSAAGKSKSMNAGMALAAVSSISFIGFLIGPPLIGIVAQFTDLRWSFAIVGVLSTFTIFLSRKSKLIQ